MTNASGLGTIAHGTTVSSLGTLRLDNVAVGTEAVTLNGIGANGVGALVGTGSASLTGAVTLASASTMGAPNAGDVLTLNGTVNGAQTLTQTGSGTVTFAAAVGGSTALTSFASAASGTTMVSGALLRTTGTQVHGGALLIGPSTTLQTTDAAITATGPVSGSLTLATGAGNVSMLNPLNDLGTVAVGSAGVVDLVDANGLAFGNSSLASLHAQTLTGDIVLNGTLSASGAGDAIVLASGGNFFNNAGVSALTATSGRWLVWSTDPTSDNRGGLTYAFKQYDADYGITSVAGAGNGFLYSIAPAITPALVGSVTRVYDGTTDAALLPSNYSLVGSDRQRRRHAERSGVRHIR